MVARLDHPAIIRVYHVLERDDSNYLVMEYVRGQDWHVGPNAAAVSPRCSWRGVSS